MADYVLQENLQKIIKRFLFASLDMCVLQNDVMQDRARRNANVDKKPKKQNVCGDIQIKEEQITYVICSSCRYEITGIKSIELILVIFPIGKIYTTVFCLNQQTIGNHFLYQTLCIRYTVGNRVLEIGV